MPEPVVLPAVHPPARRPAFLQSLGAAAMELCWLYPTTALFFQMNGLPPFPAVWGLLLFVSAVLPGRLTRGRGWRVYQVGLLHLAAGLPALLAAVHAFGRWTEPGRGLLDPSWPASVAASAAGGDWPILLLVLLSGLAFWWSGLAFSRRPATGKAVTRRFDLGAVVLAADILLGWAVNRPAPGIRLILPSFFLFSILAVSLARTAGTGRRSYPAGFRGVGIVFSLGLAVVILAPAMLPLLPLVQTAARAGLIAARDAAAAVWPTILAVLIALLKWLFRSPRGGRYEAPERSGGPSWFEEAGAEPGAIGDFMLWVMVGLTAAATAVLAGWLLWKLARYLLSRTPRRGEAAAGARPGFLLRLLAALLRRLRRKPAQPPAVAAFARLSRWGGRGGLFRRPGETPLEYGRRLAARFPGAVAAIGTIVEGLHAELYAGLPSERRRSLELRRACRELTTPRMWGARLAGWLRPE